MPPPPPNSDTVIHLPPTRPALPMMNDLPAAPFLSDGISGISTTSQTLSPTLRYANPFDGSGLHRIPSSPTHPSAPLSHRLTSPGCHPSNPSSNVHTRSRTRSTSPPHPPHSPPQPGPHPQRETSPTPTLGFYSSASGSASTSMSAGTDADTGMEEIGMDARMSRDEGKSDTKTEVIGQGADRVIVVDLHGRSGTRSPFEAGKRMTESPGRMDSLRLHEGTDRRREEGVADAYGPPGSERLSSTGGGESESRLRTRTPPSLWKGAAVPSRPNEELLFSPTRPDMSLDELQGDLPIPSSSISGTLERSPPSFPALHIPPPVRPPRTPPTASHIQQTPFRSRVSHESFLPPQSLLLNITSPTDSSVDSDKTVTPSLGGPLYTPVQIMGHDSVADPAWSRSRAPSSNGEGSLREKRPPPLSLGGVDGMGNRRTSVGAGLGKPVAPGSQSQPNRKPSRGLIQLGAPSSDLMNAWERNADLTALQQRANDLRLATEATTPLEAEPDKDIIQSPFSSKVWPQVEKERREAVGEEEMLRRSRRAGGGDVGDGEVGLVPLTAMSFASSGAGSDDLPLDIAKLDLLGKSVLQNLNDRPLANGGPHSLSNRVSTNGQPSEPSSPAVERSTNPEPIYISKNELFGRLSNAPVSSSQATTSGLLIVDSRPLPAFLASHLDRSVSLMIPSLILRRCKKAGGSKFQGGWSALEAFLATEGSRRAWEEVMQSGDPTGDPSNLDIVVLGAFGEENKESEQGWILESILRALSPEAHSLGGSAESHLPISILRFAGRWIDIKEDERFRPHLREGERSTGKTGRPAHPDHMDRLLSSGSISPPTEAASAAPAPFPMTAGPGQTTFGNIPLLPPPPIPPSTNRHAPARHPSMPSLRISVVGPGSPPSPSSKLPGVPMRRPPPKSMRIDTSGANQRSVSVGEPGAEPKSARPPKLNLNIGSLRSVKQPLRSATLGSSTGSADNQPPTLASPYQSIPPGTSAGASFQDICRAQAHLPPSPSSFSGVTRRAKVLPPNGSGSPGYGSGNVRTARPYVDSRDSASSRYIVSPDLSPSYTSNTSQTSFALMSADDLGGGEGGSSQPQGFVASTVLPGFLFLGPEPTTEAEVESLLALGIKRILNVAVECDDYERLRLKERFDKYTKLPLRDCVEETGIGKGVRDACQFLDDARLHSAPTYVHCKAGKSRSVTVVLGYLIHANAWTFKTAYAYVSERRKGISPNIGFVAELMHFEEAELGSGSKGMRGGGDGDEQLHGRGGSDSPSGSAAKRGRHNRESLPPMFSASLDSSQLQRLAIGASPDDGVAGSTTPRDRHGTQITSPRGKEVPTIPLHARGTEKEVRKNGQYVHSRRAPVNEYTLQPTRRVSKAGLESLQGGWTGTETGPASGLGHESGDLTAPVLSPGSARLVEKARTPGERQAAGWL